MDNLKKEYEEIIIEIDSLSKKFEKLEKKTVELKERYKHNPNDNALITEIKAHEEEYKTVYEKLLYLSIRAKHLKEDFE